MLKKLFAKTIELEVDELADFLDSNSGNHFSKIDMQITELNEDNTRIRNHIDYLIDTISPYNLDKEKFDDREFKLISSQIGDIQKNTGILINVLEEESHHIKLKEQTRIFEEEYENFNKRIKKALDAIQPHFKDMIPVFITKLHDLSKNIKQIEIILDDKKVDDYYNLHSNLLKLKDLGQNKETKNTISKIKIDIVKASNKLTNLEEKRSAIGFTDTFKMSEKTYNDQKKLKIKIKKEKKKIDEMFEDITPLLNAYNVKFHNKTIQEYINSPSNALLDDNGIKIQKNIKKIETMIIKETIKITKNKEIILKSIETIKKAKLKDMKENIKDIEKEIQKKKIMLSKNKIMLDVLELDYQLDHTHSKLKSLEDEMKSYQVEDEIGYETLLNESIEKMFDFTGKKIKVRDNSGGQLKS